MSAKPQIRTSLRRVKCSASDFSLPLSGAPPFSSFLRGNRCGNLGETGLPGAKGGLWEGCRQTDWAQETARCHCAPQKRTWGLPGHRRPGQTLADQSRERRPLPGPRAPGRHRAAIPGDLCWGRRVRMRHMWGSPSFPFSLRTPHSAFGLTVTVPGKLF